MRFSVLQSPRKRRATLATFATFVVCCATFITSIAMSAVVPGFDCRQLDCYGVIFPTPSLTRTVTVTPTFIPTFTVTSTPTSTGTTTETPTPTPTFTPIAGLCGLREIAFADGAGGFTCDDDLDVNIGPNSLIHLGDGAIGDCISSTGLCLDYEVGQSYLFQQQIGASSAAQTTLRAKGTRASPSVVVAEDKIATSFYGGYDGTNYETAAKMDVVIDGTAGNNDMPGRFDFSTTQDGAFSPTRRFQILANGALALSKVTPVPPALSSRGQLWTDADCLYWLDQSGGERTLGCGATPTPTPTFTITSTPTSTGTPTSTWTPTATPTPRWLEEDIDCLGSFVETLTLIPAGVLLVGVRSTVLETVTGTSTFSVGVASTPSAWGASDVAVNARNDRTTFVWRNPAFFASFVPVRLTFPTPATDGRVRIRLYYDDLP